MGFFSVPLDQETPSFITLSPQPSFSSYLWGTYFVASTWIVLSKHVITKVKIISDLNDNVGLKSP